MGIVEFLRPFVEIKAWDYAVVWKYGNDPTRFIEWLGCCCCGGNIEKLKSKEEMSEEYHLASICRDTLSHHPVKTKTCEALAKLPFTMSLYSSVHAEVAISQQPRWLIHEDSVGTQVLIPIIGGLVELFTAKHIPEDINTMKFISAYCCVSINQEAISAHSYTNMNFNVSMEGHFGESNPSTEHLSFDSNYGCLIPREVLNQSLKSHRRNKISAKRWCSLSVDCGNGEEDKENIVKEPQEKVYHAKNLITERNRRNRIKQGLFTLRSLVPNITKMDRIAILEDAIEYIMELQRQETELQEEVKTFEVEDCGKSTLQIRVQKDRELAEGTRNLPLTDLNKSLSDSTKKTQMELQVEVNRIAGKDFLIKLCCEQKQGVFSRLMEVIDSFGLHVLSANMTTFDGKVLNIIMVEATAQDIQPKKLREYLMQQTR